MYLRIVLSKGVIIKLKKIFFINIFSLSKQLSKILNKIYCIKFNEIFYILRCTNFLITFKPLPRGPAPFSSLPYLPHPLFSWIEMKREKEKRTGYKKEDLNSFAWWSTGFLFKK